MPRSVRRRSNKRVRVKRVNKNRSRRLGRRSSSKRVNRSRSRRRRRRTMRGGESKVPDWLRLPSEDEKSSGLRGATWMQEDVQRTREAQEAYKDKMAKQRADFKAAQENSEPTNSEESEFEFPDFSTTPE